MVVLRRFTLLVLVALGSGVMASSASATQFDPSGFRLESTQLSVHENAGVAVITVRRSDAKADAQIRYIAIGPGHPCGDTQCSALPGIDFKPMIGMLDFPLGVDTETFQVPITDHGYNGINKTIQVSLFGPSPIGMASPSTAVLTVLQDDPVVPRDPANPLDLATAPPPGNPLTGANFYVDPNSEPARWVHRYPGLGVIARQPGATRFGTFSGPDIGLAVSDYLSIANVHGPGTVPMIATYRIVHGHCTGHWSDPAGDQLSYHNFIARFAQGIGSYRAVLFLEMDSLITVGCLSREGVAVRMHELRDAINLLTANCPHLVIYLDAGAGDAVPARSTARRLVRAGGKGIQGFFLNATHFDWTSKEIRYGEEISRMTGGMHFVVNTGENGRGPLVPPDPVHQGNEVLCNPPGRGLGPLPTATTGVANVDAFAWTSNPGESGGACVPGAPPTGRYWPQYGLMLIHNSDFNIDSHFRIQAHRARVGRRMARLRRGHHRPARRHHRRG
ncbi:MAG: glycoside hydrolase family 6 protein [Solirubrobacteraceae bacterium]